MRLFKYLLPIISIFILCAPQAALATIDQRCFTEAQCKAARAYWEDTGEGTSFITGTSQVLEACGPGIYTSEGLKPLGFCLPSTEATTAVSFGGRTQFATIADFIRFIYRYSVGAIAIIAVVMMIIAGLQWTASGGNAESIGRAKKRIAGALTGLILAVGSYTILTTISPDLVNIQPPQAYMINTIGIAPTYCHELEDAKVALALDKKYIGSQNSEQYKKDVYTAFQNSDDVFDSTEAPCGSEYYIEGTGDQTCIGSKCDSAETCYKQIGEQVAECETGHMVGTVYNSDLGSNFIVDTNNTWIKGAGFIVYEGWTWYKEGWINKDDNDGSDIDFDLFGICNDGYIGNPVHARTTPVKSDIDNDKKRETYHLTFDEEKVENAPGYCDEKGGFKGFALRVRPFELGHGFTEMLSYDSEFHFIGKNGKDLGAYMYQINWVDKKQLHLGMQMWYEYTQMCQWNKNYFFTVDEILHGVSLDIDLGQVADIDDIPQFEAVYPTMGDECKRTTRGYFPEDLESAVTLDDILKVGLEIISATKYLNPLETYKALTE